MAPPHLRDRAAERPHPTYPAPPPERRGVASTGCIAGLRTGQGHGFIRIASGREIYLHRSDLDKDTSFNDFAVGQTVTFELLEDRVSGARALRVKRRRRPH
ncbi:MAG TPA: cold shock domain-containing protein [Bryobacteraceae bacterium]